MQGALSHSFTRLSTDWTVEQYFQNEVAWEPLDTEKDYQPFVDDDGTHYGWEKYTFDNVEGSYMVKVLNPTREELDRLVPFCPCIACKPQVNPKICGCLFRFFYGFFVCRCCVGCLASDSPRSYYMRIATEIMKKEQ